MRTSTHKSGKDKNMNQLEVLRESLGQCDEIILDALLMRNRIVEDIMVYKEANNVPILQPEQEAKQKEWLERRMQEKRHKNEVADVFESITRNSKKIQARKLFNYNIVLIGFMGAGKSTISDYLKTVFAMDIIEMDQIIAERAGMSISDIFETYGEQYFRDCETNLLIEMQSRTSCLVYSCCGFVKTSLVFPVSMISPFFITATRSHILAATPKSWVTTIMETPDFFNFSNSFRIRYSLAASTAVVISSAIINFGR